MRGVLTDLTGRHYGRLCVLGDSGARSWGSVVWSCIRSCGGRGLVRTRNLQSGQTQSCGCLKREIVRRSLGRRKK